jgi:RNA polymerase sigma-70 factor (ECF subfamily)
VAAHGPPQADLTENVVRFGPMPGLSDRERTKGFSMTGEEGVVDRLAPPGGAELADLEAFVLAHYPRLIRLAGMVTHDVDAAQDSVQSALERAWRHRPQLDDPGRLRPWLDRIVVREAIRQAGQRRGWLDRFFGTSRVGWIEVAERAATVDTALDAINLTALKAAFASLSPGHRAVVALHLHAGYSVEETARSLGVPVDTVRSRLRAARRRLRDEMSEVVS